MVVWVMLVVIVKCDKFISIGCVVGCVPSPMLLTKDAYVGLLYLAAIWLVSFCEHYSTRGWR